MPVLKVADVELKQTPHCHLDNIQVLHWGAQQLLAALEAIEVSYAVL